MTLYSCANPPDPLMVCRVGEGRCGGGNDVLGKISGDKGGDRERKGMRGIITVVRVVVVRGVVIYGVGLRIRVVVGEVRGD